MPTMPPVFRPPHAPTRTEARREHDARRGSAASRGYDSRWEKARATYLARHPLCAYCALEGRTRAAMVVDHLYPHKGDRQLFWSVHWWVASCTDCHNGMKQRLERLGRAALDTLARRLGRPVH